MSVGRAVVKKKKYENPGARGGGGVTLGKELAHPCSVWARSSANGTHRDCMVLTEKTP